MRDAPGIIAWDRNSSLCQVMRLGSRGEGRGGLRPRGFPPLALEQSGRPVSAAGRGTAREIAALLFFFLPVSSPSSPSLRRGLAASCRSQQGEVRALPRRGCG